MTWRPAIGAVLVVVLAACGGGGGVSGESCPAGSVLTILPAAARVTAGGAGVPFAAGLSNCSADMRWSLAGPGAIDRTEGVPVTYLPPASVAAQATATLTVSAGGLSAAAVITIDPSSQQLAGRVIGGNGAPVAGATVRVGTATATTGADGTFTLPAVAPPYELVVTAPGGLTSSWYPELRRSDPTLVLFDEAPGFPRFAQASGALSGGAGFPSPAGHEAGVAFAAPEGTALAPVQPGADTFLLGLAWPGPASSATGALHALQWAVGADQRPATYHGHARRAGVTLTSGATAAGQDLALQPVGTAQLSGTLDEGGAPFSASLALFANLGDGARLRILPPPRDPSGFPQVGFTSAFALATPALAGATVDVVARKDLAGGAFQEAHRHGLAPDATGVALSFGGLPVQNHPAAGATVGAVPGLVFDWYAMSGNPVYVASFRGPAGSQGYDVFTMRQQVTAPPGVAFQVPANYRWKVRASTAFASVDDAAGPGGWLGGAGAFLRAESAEWPFTTAP